jgi:molecular chaperone GrpE
MYEGISTTDAWLSKAFEKNGLKILGSRGEKFDPNMHDALFEYGRRGARSRRAGHEVGLMLDNRVVRPAEVGVWSR